MAYGTSFALTRPAKLPVFDGALAIDNFAMGNLRIAIRKIEGIRY